MSGWSTEAMDTMIANKGDAQDDSPESGEHEVRAEGEHHVKDVLERSFERGESVGKFGPKDSILCGKLSDAEPVQDPPEEDDGEEDHVEAEVKQQEESASMGREKAYPDLSNLTVRKIPHKNLILDGVCRSCSCCGHALTDSVSIQRGTGPRCDAKGYSEDPTDADEMQALIDLAEFPELVDFLMEHYKPLGIRGLVNGLVRVASLNRPRGRGWSEGNAKVHAACCDAIQSLGHKLMADLLRETLVIMTVKDAEGIPGALSVWVKKRDWFVGWSYGLKRIPGAYFSRKHNSNIVPVHDPSDPKRLKMTGRNRTTADGRTVPETNKAALWALMLEHYEGCVAKVNGKVIKIGK